jgi:hypothetical protein
MRGRLAFAQRDDPPLRALRANRVFRADEKHIRTENAVLNKTRNRLGLY